MSTKVDLTAAVCTLYGTWPGLITKSQAGPKPTASIMGNVPSVPRFPQISSQISPASSPRIPAYCLYPTPTFTNSPSLTEKHLSDGSRFILRC